jgi:hypothetical protein
MTPAALQGSAACEDSRLRAGVRSRVLERNCVHDVLPHARKCAPYQREAQ